MRESRPSWTELTFSPRSSANFASSSVSSSLRRIGTSTRISTTRSPRRVVRNDGTPRPRNRNRAGLGAGRDVDLARSVERLDLDLRSERGLHDRDRELVPELVTPAFEVGMARRAPRRRDRRGRPRAARPDRDRRGAAADRRRCRRHVDVDRGRPVDPAGAAAGLARVRHDLAGRAARGARPGGDDLAEEGAAHLADLATPLTGGAAIRMRTRRAAAPRAVLALDGHLQVEGLARAVHDVFQGQFEDGLRVGPAFPPPPGPRAGAPPKNASNRSLSPNAPASNGLPPPNGPAFAPSGRTCRSDAGVRDRTTSRTPG